MTASLERAIRQAREKDRRLAAFEQLMRSVGRDMAEIDQAWSAEDHQPAERDKEQRP